jgi:hypothetical protein
MKHEDLTEQIIRAFYKVYNTPVMAFWKKYTRMHYLLS